MVSEDVQKYLWYDEMKLIEKKSKQQQLNK